MKRSLMDRLVGYFSPTAEARRLQARLSKDAMLRAYDAAQTYSTSDWVSANKSSPNTEIKAALKSLRERSRDLARNNPYAVRALDVIVSNTIGSGLIPNIRGKNDAQTQKVREAWNMWAESTRCDAEGRHDFYGLQALLMRSIVESGEALALRKYVKVNKETRMVLQILESDFIKSDLDSGNVLQGIEFDSSGVRTKYHLFKKHPGDAAASEEVQPIPASEVLHVYRTTRPGQMRGVPWAHSAIEKLKDFDDYQKATLIRQKVAACFGGFVTTNGTDSMLTASQLKTKREAEFSLEPATFRYLQPGEDIKLASPPGVESYEEFSRETLRAVAAGYGVSYEALTGDYSNVNFSSGRMGHIEFRRNIDAWRWSMIIPQFCNPAFEWFKEWANLNGVNTDGVIVDWTAPAHTMIDPNKEISALKEEVRSGFKTYGEAVREQGRDPEATIIEFAEWNKKIDELKLSFDSDPRRMSGIGFAQAGDTLSKLSEADYLKNEVEVSEEE